MNKLFTGLLFMALFVGASAGAFTHGFATGFISKKIEKRFSSPKKEPIRKYNMMTIDTGLMEFPPNLTLNSMFVHPQCIEVKILQPREPLTKVQTMATMLLFLILCGMPIHICINGTDEDREFMCAFIIGRLMASDSDSD